MRNSFFCILLFVMSSFSLLAQTEEQTPTPDTPAPSNSLDQLNELFYEFNFQDLGNGMQIDTMIFRQFGGSNQQGAEMDQMMQEMMQMMQQQMQAFDFGDMQGFDQLFEELNLEGLDLPAPNADPNADPKAKKKAPTKKRKTYKL